MKGRRDKENQSTVQIYRMWNKTRGVPSVWHRFGAHHGASKIPARAGREVCVIILLTLRNLNQRSRDSATESRQILHPDRTQSPLPQPGPGAQAGDHSGHVGATAALRQFSPPAAPGLASGRGL